MPTPELEPDASVRVEGDWLVGDLRDPLAPRPKTVALPEDFYLRELMDLDPSDLETIAAWNRSYGRFCGWGTGLDTDNWGLEREDEVLELADREHPERRAGATHKDLLRVYVNEAQEAITTWIACRREGGLDALVETEVNEEELTRLRADNAHRDDGWPQNLDQLREFVLWSKLAQLKGAMQAALQVFSVGIGSLTDRHPTIYSVAFLQLYNHLAEDAVIRTCASETCGRDFVRQRGRAEYGQNRTSGIKYCTRECARAQAQREHRRRRKAAATDPRLGETTQSVPAARSEKAAGS
ncbi:hypothetical protein AB0M92_39000 [Streptomyces sp. NPDC051582]|uniref:hypothetical protein n=1 Tax=Streptomyces sp. NPDC051582 TaxID=3155167 RepID=UPI0034340AC8